MCVLCTTKTCGVHRSFFFLVEAEAEAGRAPGSNHCHRNKKPYGTSTAHNPEAPLGAGPHTHQHTIKVRYCR